MVAWPFICLTHPNRVFPNIVWVTQLLWRVFVVGNAGYPYLFSSRLFILNVVCSYFVKMGEDRQRGST